MHTDVLTNCLISLGLSRIRLHKLSRSSTNKKNSIMMMTKFPEQSSYKMVQIANGVTAAITMKPKGEPRRKFHPSLNLSQFFVTQIIVWLMRIRHFVKFMMLQLIISATAECSFSPLKRVKTRTRSSMIQET